MLHTLAYVQSLRDFTLLLEKIEQNLVFCCFQLAKNNPLTPLITHKTDGSCDVYPH